MALNLRFHWPFSEWERQQCEREVNVQLWYIIGQYDDYCDAFIVEVNGDDLEKNMKSTLFNNWPARGEISVAGTRNVGRTGVSGDK